MATQESTAALKKSNDVEANATVIVASKLPMDLIARLYNAVERAEPVMGGGVRKFRVYEPRPDTKAFIFQGNSFPQNKGAHQRIVAGYALTHDIPKAFWDEWLAQNEKSDYITNGMIFAHTQDGSTVAHAKEMEGEKSNLERLDPDNLPKGLKTDDTRRAS
ncbi:hypothetical protein [Paraburkholderia tuberum]|uniref:Uncharacterized protein n=1 Tax=Paraburkholderia tuberum TaxID=157910 RepID=A0A1H1GXG6_9BURK|nr:hypothetical protein [Paraburkholderia tuberum]SDR17568.1 hypothetical protein SAMN05445850_3127 [Paraburkholderia tuberum]